jgi:hypothetical protein
MNFQEIQNNYFNKKFLILYLVIFTILYIFCSFVKFLGQLPVLIVLTLIITYYSYNMLDYKMKNLFN